MLREWDEGQAHHGPGQGLGGPGAGGGAEALENDRADTVGSAELLASELVTNALIHTDHGAVVTVTVLSATLRVEVRDFMAGLPLPDQPSPGSSPYFPRGSETFASVPAIEDLSPHGRGLLLVRELADSWGVRTQSAGKVIWFELRKGRPE
nr:ATP-binding protein [Streptomyces sp. CWNU-1]